MDRQAESWERAANHAGSSFRLPAAAPNWRVLLVGAASVAALASVTGAAAVAGLWKIVIVAWISFGAMATGAFAGARGPSSVRGLVWGYGLTSGAMTASAAAFLVPEAVGLQSKFGGFGIAAGLLAGFVLEVLASRGRRHGGGAADTTVLRITAHGVAAGLVIGMVYAELPSAGLLLGVAIVSHKAPAGYAAARWLSRQGLSPVILLLPAVGEGVPAAVVGLLQPAASEVAQAVLFGFGAGIFLHVASDFLPRPASAHIGQSGHDPRRVDAAASTLLGGLAVFAAWLAVQA